MFELRPEAKRRLLDLAMWQVYSARQPFVHLNELWRAGLCERTGSDANGYLYRINSRGTMLARQLWRDGHRNTVFKEAS